MTSPEDKFEERVTLKVANALLAPVRALLFDLRRMVVFLFIIIIAVQIGLLYYVHSSNASRERTVDQIQVSVQRTTAASNEAKAAAEKASADLTSVINASRSGAINQQVLARVVQEIDCIAKGHVPCP